MCDRVDDVDAMRAALDYFLHRDAQRGVDRARDRLAVRVVVDQHVDQLRLELKQFRLCFVLFVCCCVERQ